jgi:predicted DNA-binding ribbon-helix-helix protein
MDDIEKSIQMPCQSVVKRSIVIAGHKTSVSLEDAFWKGLRQIAAIKEMTLSELAALIDKDRQQGNLSSHIRLFVLEYYQAQASTANAAEQITASTTATTPR